jgi:hypothetical protein
MISQPAVANQGLPQVGPHSAGSHESTQSAVSQVAQVADGWSFDSASSLEITFGRVIAGASDSDRGMGAVGAASFGRVAAAAALP